MPDLTPPAVPIPATATTLSALKPGARFTQPRPPGSGDGWLLADLARQAGKPLVVLTADPLEAQRLADEIRNSRPNCACASCPTGKPCPTTRSRPTRT